MVGCFIYDYIPLAKYVKGTKTTLSIDFAIITEKEFENLVTTAMYDLNIDFLWYIAC